MGQAGGRLNCGTLTPTAHHLGGRFSTTKLESTVRYLGIEVDDALNIAEQIEL
jgi:hypothetical protein